MKRIYIIVAALVLSIFFIALNNKSTNNPDDLIKRIASLENRVDSLEWYNFNIDKSNDALLFFFCMYVDKDNPENKEKIITILKAIRKSKNSEELDKLYKSLYHEMKLHSDIIDGLIENNYKKINPEPTKLIRARK
jgi:hypothetical protein